MGGRRDRFDKEVEASLRRDLPIVTTLHAKYHLDDCKGAEERSTAVSALDTFETALVTVQRVEDTTDVSTKTSGKGTGVPAIKVTSMLGKHVPPGPIISALNEFLKAVQRHIIVCYNLLLFKKPSGTYIYIYTVGPSYQRLGHRIRLSFTTIIILPPPLRRRQPIKATRSLKAISTKTTTTAISSSNVAIRIYISGDTLLVDELNRIAERYGGGGGDQPIDLMLVHLVGTTIPSPNIPLLIVTMDAEQGFGLGSIDQSRFIHSYSLRVCLFLFPSHFPPFFSPPLRPSFP